MLSRERLEKIVEDRWSVSACEAQEMARELLALKESLKVAVELTEMDDEFNRVGTDSWVWLQLARELMLPAPPAAKEE